MPKVIKKAEQVIPPQEARQLLGEETQEEAPPSRERPPATEETRAMWTRELVKDIRQGRWKFDGQRITPDTVGYERLRQLNPAVADELIKELARANGPRLTDQQRMVLHDAWVSTKEYDHEVGYVDEIEWGGILGTRIASLISRDSRRLLESMNQWIAVMVFDDGSPEQFQWTDEGRALFESFNDSPQLRGYDEMASKKATATVEEPKVKGKSGPKAKVEGNGEAKAKPKKEVQKDPEKVKAEACGLNVVQYRLLKCLDKAGTALSYREIEASTEKMFGVGYYSNLTAMLREDKEGSLGSLGYVKEVQEDRGGKDILCFQLTKAGEKCLAKAD